MKITKVEYRLRKGDKIQYIQWIDQAKNIKGANKIKDTIIREWEEKGFIYLKSSIRKILNWSVRTKYAYKIRISMLEIATHNVERG